MRIVDYSGFIYSLSKADAVVSISRKCGSAKRVVRRGGVIFDDGHVRWFVPPSEPLKNQKVYLVVISKDTLARWHYQQKSFYCVATSEDSAKSALNKQFGRIIKNSAGLAKRTLGVGMSKVATQSGTGRMTAGVARTARVLNASNKYSDARVWINGEEYGVRMESNLCYALDAVRGGSSAVDFAVRKATNKTAGYINYYIGGSLDPSNRRMLTPFRDIVGRR